jgi:hypothetical protein
LNSLFNFHKNYAGDEDEDEDMANPDDDEDGDDELDELVTVIIQGTFAYTILGTQTMRIHHTRSAAQQRSFWQQSLELGLIA